MVGTEKVELGILVGSGVMVGTGVNKGRNGVDVDCGAGNVNLEPHAVSNIKISARKRRSPAGSAWLDIRKSYHRLSDAWLVL